MPSGLTRPERASHSLAQTAADSETTNAMGASSKSEAPIVGRITEQLQQE
jgi:hypothetical protein